MNGRMLLKFPKKFFKNKVILTNEHLVISKHPAYTKILIKNVDTFIKKDRVLFLSKITLIRH
jgi:hypothetical protein